MSLADDAAEASRRAHEKLRRLANDIQDDVPQEKDDTHPHDMITEDRFSRPSGGWLTSPSHDPTITMQDYQRVMHDPSLGGKLPLLGDGPGMKPLPKWSERFISNQKFDENEVIHMVTKYSVKELVRRLIKKLVRIVAISIAGIMLISYLAIGQPFEYATSTSGALALVLLLYIVFVGATMTRQFLIWKSVAMVITNRRVKLISIPFWGTKFFFAIPVSGSTILTGNLKSSGIECEGWLNLQLRLDTVNLDALEQSNDEKFKNLRGLKDATEVDEICNKLAEIYGIRGRGQL